MPEQLSWEITIHKGKKRFVSHWFGRRPRHEAIQLALEEAENMSFLTKYEPCAIEAKQIRPTTV